MAGIPKIKIRPLDNDLATERLTSLKSALNRYQKAELYLIERLIKLNGEEMMYKHMEEVLYWVPSVVAVICVGTLILQACLRDTSSYWIIFVIGWGLSVLAMDLGMSFYRKKAAQVHAEVVEAESALKGCHKKIRNVKQEIEKWEKQAGIDIREALQEG